ncbi:MAG: thioredoxin family protein [Flavobacteriaceae bacterium]|nr:thioredoxin family protein [Flavobacteriaceae bacterium]
MKKLILFLGVFYAFLSYQEEIQAQKIIFIHNQLSKAKSKAKKKDKILFIDAYASWCGPCKILDQKIFKDKIVANFHKEHFINCKIDLESVIGSVFSDDHPIESIPTLFYFNSDYELIYKKIGVTEVAEEFITYGQAALDIAEHLKSRAPIKNEKSLFHYTYYLKEEGKNYQPYFKSFLKNQKDWSSTDAMQIIFDLAEERDTVALNYFLIHATDFEKIFGKEAVHEKRMMLVLDVILDFLDNSSAKPDFEKAKPIFVRYFGQEEYLEHLLLFKFRYHQQHNQRSAMRHTLDEFITKVVSKMPDGKEKAIEYIQAATTYYDLAQGQEDLQAKAFAWGEQAEKLYQGYEVFSILAILYQDAGLLKHAKIYQMKANQSKKSKD